MADFYSKTLESERKDWRQHPMTEAALAMLRENREHAARAVLEAPATESHPVITHNIAYHKAINDIIDMLERE